MELGLGGKTAVVTGGSGGLGRAVCDAFCAEGANVVVHYFTQKVGTLEFADGLSNRYGAAALPLQADLRNSSEIDAMFAAVVSAFGGFDILVNNAGTWPQTMVRDLSEEEWDETLRINLTSAFMTSKRAVNHFVETSRKGRIINVISINGINGATRRHAHYAAAKGGLLTFTYSLAREVAEYGITVNAVCPGMMRTNMNRKVLEEHEEEYIARIPLGRISEPEEVASSVVFLASDLAGYITGSTLNATGGMMMR